MAETLRLLARRRLHLPRAFVDRQIRFADGTVARVYRETVVDIEPGIEPVTLIVAFRLRGVGASRIAHAVFRCESVLNTVLFAGFPGFVSKLWMAHDSNNRYRGMYDWDGHDNAEAYVRTLWWPLMVVSQRRSIRYHIIRGVSRDTVVADPAAIRDEGQWWRPIVENRRPSPGDR